MSDRMKTSTGLTYFRKGSAKAKEHMAKLRKLAAAAPRKKKNAVPPSKLPTVKPSTTALAKVETKNPVIRKEVVVRRVVKETPAPTPAARHNPPAFFVIDTQTHQIQDVVRGHPAQTFPKAFAKAQDRARVLGRTMALVVHPYVPAGFKRGVIVTPLFYHYGATYVDPSGKYTKNPLTSEEQTEMRYSARGLRETSRQTELPEGARSYLEGQADAYRDVSGYYGPTGGSDDRRNNPIDISVGKFIGDVIGGIAFGVGAGVTERYIMTSRPRKNPAPQYVEFAHNPPCPNPCCANPRAQYVELAHNPEMTRDAQEFISDKISKLYGEGYPQRQAIRIAYEMAHRGGYSVPPPPRKNNPRTAEAVLMGTPLKFEAEKIAGLISREGIPAWTAPWSDQWGVCVSQEMKSRGTVALGQILKRNPQRPKTVKEWCFICGEWDPLKGPYHSGVKGLTACDRCYRGMRSGRAIRAPWADITVPSQRGHKMSKNPAAAAILMASPAKLEVDKIAGWISREGVPAWVAPSDGQWGVWVSKQMKGRGAAALGRVLKRNPGARESSNPMKFMTKAVIKSLPPLYSQEKVEDPIAYVKFFAPWTNWTWYALEFDGQDRFFGLVQGQEEELGYFSLAELQSIRGRWGLKVERDLHFRPTPLSKIRGKDPAGRPLRNPTATAYTAKGKRRRVSSSDKYPGMAIGSRKYGVEIEAFQGHIPLGKIVGTHAHARDLTMGEVRKFGYTPDPLFPPRENPLLQTVMLATGNPGNPKGWSAFISGTEEFVTRVADWFRANGIRSEVHQNVTGSYTVFVLSSKKKLAGPMYRKMPRTTNPPRRGCPRGKVANNPPRIPLRRNPGGPIDVPFKEGERISIARARAWVNSTGDRELIRQFNEAERLQKKANKPSTHLTWQTLPIGSPTELEMVTAMTHYGETPETVYKPPKGSKKGRHMYKHEWGEGTRGGKPVPVLASADGKAMIMPMGKGQTVGDWMRG